MARSTNWSSKCNASDTYGQNFAHDIGSSSATVLAKIVESLQVGLVQCVTNDFDVHFVQILLRNAVDEEWSQWCVNQNGVVQLSRVGSNMDGFHLLETAQRMAFRNQLRDGTLMQCARDQQDDVVNHVAVRDEVQKGGQRFDGMVSQVLELNHQFLTKLIVDDRHRQRRWLVGQELTVIGALQVKFQICKNEKNRINPINGTRNDHGRK